jgi:hypothetical protein
MLIQKAVDYFGSLPAIAKALHPINRTAVYQWKRVVPLHRARELERLSAGKLKVDLRLYKPSGMAKQTRDY